LIGADEITADENGNVLVTGYTDHSWDGPDGQPPLNDLSGGFSDGIFVLKLDQSGAYQWHTFYGTGIGGDYTVAVDGSGNALVAGRAIGSWNGPDGQSPLNPYSGESDVVVLKLDANGAYLWHTFHGGSDSDQGRAYTAIAVGAGAEIYISGETNGPWTGPAGEAPLAPYLGVLVPVLFVLALDQDGAYRWHAFYGQSNGSGACTNYNSSIAADSSGDLLMTGESGCAWDGPEGQAPVNAFVGYDNLFALKLDTSGAYQWHTFYEVDSHLSAVGESGDFYFTGDASDSWDGPDGQSPLHEHAGGGFDDPEYGYISFSDAFIVKLGD
jgi:hypothetical protein